MEVAKKRHKKKRVLSNPFLKLPDLNSAFQMKWAPFSIQPKTVFRKLSFVSRLELLTRKIKKRKLSLLKSFMLFLRN